MPCYSDLTALLNARSVVIGGKPFVEEVFDQALDLVLKLQPFLLLLSR